MSGFWVRFFITACGLLGAASLLIAALMLCAVNAIVRSIMLLLTLLKLHSPQRVA